MRLMLSLALAFAVACTGSPPPLPDAPRAAPAPGTEKKIAEADKAYREARAKRYPDQGPPPPSDTDVELAQVPSWDGTTWSLSDERTLKLTATSASLADETLEHSLGPGGGPLGSYTVRVVTPCALALWTGETWLEADRTVPACTPEELAVTPQQTTWDFERGTFYSFYPGGQAWRRTKGRKYRHPVGTWTETDGVRTAVFGESEMVLHPVGPCFLALELPEYSKLNRTSRSFPSCEPEPYTGLPFTLWKTENGDWVDLYGPGTGKYDAQRRKGRDDLSWKPVEGGFEATVSGEGQETRTFVAKVEGCSATITGEGMPTLQAERTWPPCEGRPQAASTP